MPYVYLLAAISSEVFGTSILRSTNGFTRLWPTVACLGAYVASFAFLSQCVRDIPVGVAYALWSALGTAAIVAIGVVFLNESISMVKVAGVALIIVGVVVLQLGGAS